MDAYQHLDFYDVSMVDGSNLPMYIRIAHGKTKNRISANGCERGVGSTSEVHCRAALQVPHGGPAVACISPFARFGTDRYCSARYPRHRSPCASGTGRQARVRLTSGDLTPKADRRPLHWGSCSR